MRKIYATADAPKGVTAFEILIQATGNSQKLCNHVLKIAMQPSRAVDTRFMLITGGIL